MVQSRLIKNLTYKDNDFATGELAAGFLFELDEHVTDMGTIQPMGGLELLYDLSEDIDYKYIHHGETNVVKDTIRKYSKNRGPNWKNKGKRFGKLFWD